MRNKGRRKRRGGLLGLIKMIIKGDEERGRSMKMNEKFRGVMGKVPGPSAH